MVLLEQRSLSEAALTHLKRAPLFDAAPASDAVLAHLRRAHVPDAAPLPLVPPRAPQLAQWGGWAESAVVENRLRSALAQGPSRQRLHRNLKALRDFEAGRSPPQSTKSAAARATLIVNSLGGEPPLCSHSYSAQHLDPPP